MGKRDSVLVVIALVFLVALLVIAVRQPPRKSVDESINAAFSNYDQNEVNRLRGEWRATEANQRGDTYCTKCEKVNPGKVRICTYCGQYID